MRAVQGLVRRIPPVAALLAERDRLRRQNRKLRRGNKALREQLSVPTVEPGTSVMQKVLPGHFYSPIPDLNDVRERAEQIFDRNRAELPGIELNVADQLALLEPFAALYAEQPFAAEPYDDLRYGFVNGYFPWGDGLALYSMLRRLRPNRVIEIGSGWSSALMLDVNERFLDGKLQMTFIEPYPDRLNTLLRPADRATATILEQPLHAVPNSLFAELEPGDFLFVDSTHVSRIGSDVNRLWLELVPGLPAGVNVHVHDIFWPFEYPEHWVYEGLAWNEAYLVRALLIGHPGLRVTWFNNYLHHQHRDAVMAAMPLWANDPGASLWLRTS